MIHFPKLAPEDSPLREDQLDFIKCEEPLVFKSGGSVDGWYYVYRDQDFLNKHSRIFETRDEALSEYFKHLNFGTTKETEVADRMAAAIEQTFKQYSRDCTEKDEYEVTFLYPANNRAYQMLLHALNEYKNLRKI